MAEKAYGVWLTVALVAAVCALVLLRTPRGRQGKAVSPPPSALPSGRPVLLELGSRHCLPCRQMAPILEELRQDYGGHLEVVSVDVNEQPESARRFGIQVIPTQVFLDTSGREVFRHIGFYPKEELLAKLRELGLLEG